jgi:hypothetical protein
MVCNALKRLGIDLRPGVSDLLPQSFSPVSKGLSKWKTEGLQGVFKALAL